MGKLGTGGNGAGQFFKPPHPRPRMVQFAGCRNVRFEGVTLTAT